MGVAVGVGWGVPEWGSLALCSRRASQHLPSAAFPQRLPGAAASLSPRPLGARPQSRAPPRSLGVTQDRRPVPFLSELP